MKHVVFTKGVIKADMISTPRIFGLLCHSSDFITSFDNIGVERKLPVVETSPYGPTRSMVFSDQGHSATLLACEFLEKAMSVGKWRESLYLCDTLVNRLEGLMLAHVIDHFRMGPALVLGQSSPVVVVLSGATCIPGGRVSRLL